MSAVAKPAPAPFSMMGPIDIVESDKQYVFKVDAPGIRREDVHVRVVDGALQVGACARWWGGHGVCVCSLPLASCTPQISGERSTETTKDEGKFKVRERSSGKVSAGARGWAGARRARAAHTTNKNTPLRPPRPRSGGAPCSPARSAAPTRAEPAAALSPRHAAAGPPAQRIGLAPVGDPDPVVFPHLLFPAF